MKYKVQTKEGSIIVNNANEAISYFKGFFNDFSNGKDDKIAGAVFISYLLLTNKITPIEV